jgi:hypothetical protein
MRLYSFICRVAFVFNLLFLISALMHWADWDTRYPQVFGFLLIAYILCVFFINPLANLITAILLLSHKRPAQHVGRWVLLLNFFFLLFQLIFIFLLNDPFNN